MKKTNRLTTAFTLVVLLSVFLSACSPKNVQPEETVPETTAEAPRETKAIKIEVEETVPETKAEPVYFPEGRETVDGKVRSYLTGEWEDVKYGSRRPLAIMMSNDKAANPQYGINHAAIVYEAPVEGSLNRFMAIIEDFDELERMGSVRSCRTYYTYFAKEWDAVYAHFGQSTFAEPYLKNVDNINGIAAYGDIAYFRSKDRKSPHNAYASGKGILEAAAKHEYNWNYDKDYKGHYRFMPDGEEITYENSLEAFTVFPGYDYNNPWFAFDENDKLYHRYQYGDVHNGDEGPITVKNIIFEYHATAHYATTDYLNIDVHGDTYGYFITNGRAIPVSVKKDGEFGVTHYYDMEGNEIILNNGKTWVCIIRSDQFDKTSIFDRNGNRTDK